jgi:hypothetical protein
VNKRLTIGLAAVAFAATLAASTAGPYKRDAAAPRKTSPSEIFAAARAIGLNPAGLPFRRGPYYLLHAYDAQGFEVRVVADADFGDIIAVEPLHRPRYDAGPRIIHVPQHDERSDVFVDEEPGQQSAPARKRKAKPPQRRSSASPSAKPRRAVLNAPPPAHELSPIYPTPKFGAKEIRQGERFAPPADNSLPPAADAQN